MKRSILAKTLLVVALSLGMLSGAYANDNQAQQYPKTQREAPQNDLRSQRDSQQLQDGFNALNKGANQKAAEILGKLLKNTSSKYAKAMAFRGLAQIKLNAHQYPAALTLLQKSLDLNSMPNNDYFNTMLTIAQVQAQSEQWKPALVTLQKWMKEGGKQSGKAYALQGNIFYRLNQYQNAINSMKQALGLNKSAPESWQQILMASYFELGQYTEAAKLEETVLTTNPGNKKALANLVNIYIKANEPAKALTAMAAAKARGVFSTEADYLKLARLYVYIAQNQKNANKQATQAAQTLQEGIKKGIVKPGLKPYKLMGNAYYLAGDYKKAIAAWSKASPFATNGEVDFTLGNVQMQDGQYRKGRTTLRRALKRGIKRVGAAWILIGNADINLRNHKGAIYAYRQAAKDPATRVAAEKWLRGQKRGR